MYHYPRYYIERIISVSLDVLVLTELYVWNLLLSQMEEDLCIEK